MVTQLASSSSSLFPPPPPLQKLHDYFPTITPRRILIPAAALKSPRGFGPANKKTTTTTTSNKKPKPNQTYAGDDEEEEERPGDTTIPEVVTNRMIQRMGLSVGAPLVVGISFFPLFYYFKVVAKVDIPTWIPFGVSFFFFGTALLGVSYAIVSASWDPLREGSLLGWNEARRNWPLFWDSLWGGAANRRNNNK